MEKETSDLDKAMKIIIMLAVLIASISVAYYFVIFLPQKEKTQLDLQKQEIEQQKQEKEVQDLKEQEAREGKLQSQIDLLDCENAEQQDYSSNWDKACKTQGLKNDCSLPSEISDRLDKSLQDGKNNCFRKYPQN